MNTQIVYALSAALVALSFAALSLALIKTLLAARQTLDSAKTTLKQADETIEALQGKVERLAENANEISTDIRNKLHSADGLFRAARDAGAAVRETTDAARQIAASLSGAVRRQAAAIERRPDGGERWMEWAQLGAKAAGTIKQAAELFQGKDKRVVKE
ncbi:DUF948 domain-containing protein [Cohnella massiliensis]|uniref:DUF948 domain-containing protein n=1 Tax=Cohnella massiliensis TaxID=1816691 RepID=UPI0009BBAB0C|nr:DUF948 domain-containing protein [Cohnella massiliensis]